MSTFTFSELDIKPNVKTFVGDKVKVKNIINKQIKVVDFKIGPSTAKPGTDFMTVQIEKNNEPHIFFTSSATLIDQIKRVPKEKFPFTTTIVNDKNYYEFT